MSDEKQNEIIIYRTDDGKSNISLFARDGSVWLNQTQMADLFATSKPNISTHISNILKENELQENSVVKFYLTTAQKNDLFYARTATVSKKETVIGYTSYSSVVRNFRRTVADHFRDVTKMIESGNKTTSKTWIVA